MPDLPEDEVIRTAADLLSYLQDVAKFVPLNDVHFSDKTGTVKLTAILTQAKIGKNLRSNIHLYAY